MVCVFLFFFFVVLIQCEPSQATTAQTEDVTLEKVNRAREAIDKGLGLRSQRRMAECDGSCIPKMVRFAFHMCVGGCDGCLNFNQGSNKGLGGIGTLLNQIYEDPETAISSFLTRADFWALAADEAAVVGTENQQGNNRVLFKSEWQWGRKDCPTSPLLQVEHEFPEARDSCANSVVRFLMRDMKMDAAEMVAVIGGGHSLGQAKVSNSGYRGPWSTPIETMDNGYFRALMSFDYVHTTHSPSHFAWTLPNGLMMFNSDMCLFRNIDNHIDQEGRLTPCLNRRLCASRQYDLNPVFQPIVASYALSPSTWMNKFQSGWKKMNTHLNSALSSPCPETSTNCRRRY